MAFRCSGVNEAARARAAVLAISVRLSGVSDFARSSAMATAPACFFFGLGIPQ